MNRMKSRKNTRREQRARKEPLQFMWAFGSNLSLSQMKQRCPDAKPYKALHIPNGRLVFRGVADVEYSEGGIVPGALYRITPQCERALDIYEGVDRGIYEKKYLKITIKSMGNKQFKVLYYKMKLDGILPPSEEYIDRIAEGYRDWNLDTAYLDEALQRSWDDKEPTETLRRRHIAKGCPRLARPEPVCAEGEVIDVDAS
jgi:gamma-glutamylcyclotransferase